MKLRKSHFVTSVVLLAGALLAFGCGEDEATSPNGVPTACTTELCADNENLRNECVQEYNVCLGTGESADECAALAGLTCRLI